MLSPGTRRQNRSCDQCRRSKRRCLPATDDGATGEHVDTTTHSGTGNSTKVCRNCCYLRQSCTYEFVNSRSQTKRATKSKQANQDHRIRNCTDAARSDGQRLEGEQSQSDRDLGNRQLNDASPIPPVADLPSTDASEVFSAFRLNDTFDLDLFLNGGADAIFDLSSFTAGNIQFPGADAASLDQGAQSHEENALLGHTGSSGTAFTPVAPQSPKTLLTFSFTMESEDRDLAGVFNSMLGAILSRCLHASTNIFAASIQSEYDLSPEGSGPGAKDSPDGAVESVNTKEHTGTGDELTLPLSSRPDVTMIGLCLFLDHFAPFYGFWADRKTRQGHLQAFRSVMRAFSLNSFPTSAPGADRYKPAWHRAYADLQSLKSTPSFVFIYAVLLFTHTTPPDDAQTPKGYIQESKELLELALGYFQLLQDHVSGYCARLEPTSMYRHLLLKALIVLHWYAFIRDTVESFMEEREPILKSAVDETTDLSMPADQIISDFEPRVVATFCRKGIAHIVILIRRCLRLRSASTLSSASQPILPKVISCISWIARHDSAYDRFLKACFESFYASSHDVRLSIVFLVISWNFGVMSFFDLIREDQALTCEVTSNLDLGVRFQRLQATALRNITTLCGLLMNDPAETFPVDSSAVIMLPILAHHSNTKLIVTSIKKAITNYLYMRESGLVDGELQGRNGMQGQNSDALLRALIWCLVSLQATASGRVHTRKALDEIVGQWGDSFLECWTVDERA